MQLQSDVCFVTRYNQWEFESMLLARLCDLLFTGPTQFRALVIRKLKSLRAGELETLSSKSPITFTGLMIVIDTVGTVILSREPYIRELPTMDIESRIAWAKVSNPADLRSTFRQSIGALLWVHKTRPDIGFTIAHLSKSSADA